MEKEKKPKVEKPAKEVNTSTKRKKNEIIDKVVKGNQLKYNTPVEAWDGLMKKFILQDPELFENSHGAVITNAIYTNDLIIYISNPVFDGQFDFGYYFNYGQTKWTSLLNNYIDLDKVDGIKRKIRELEENKVVNRNYNLGLHFADSHDNGKGCLLSGILSRHYYIEKPIFTVVLRASEIVTRLPFDLLFFSRLGEYIYGHTEFTLKVDIKQAFADDNVILMYNNREKIADIFKDISKSERKESLLNKLDSIMAIKSENDFTTYQAHLRSFKVLRPDLYPDRKPLLAKDCIIGDWEGIPLPDVCPSIIDRNNIKKMYLKMVEKYGLNMEKITGKTDKKKKKKIIKAR